VGHPTFLEAFTVSGEAELFVHRHFVHLRGEGEARGAGRTRLGHGEAHHGAGDAEAPAFTHHSDTADLHMLGQKQQPQDAHDIAIDNGDDVRRGLVVGVALDALRHVLFEHEDLPQDGKTILYWLDKGGIKQIYELQVANPKEPGRRITGPSVGPANDPVYSPDGKQVLFTRELNGNKTSDIWLVNIDGSNPHRVTTNPAREMDPTWSPDGNWFAFVRGEYDKPIIVIAKKDGTDETTLTQGTAREAHPCWF